ncbi:MAG TPA: hypothetical protein VEV84_13990 [Pyrinomonadaceae bacterium]|nr:hypothetical protein [Pyrinomonadaceae bacterium]
MSPTIALVAMVVACIASIYLIAKGVEVLLRGMKPGSPTRGIDLVFGAIMLVLGAAVAIIGYVWLFPMALKK